jgi:hypothetical protein
LRKEIFEALIAAALLSLVAGNLADTSQEVGRASMVAALSLAHDERRTSSAHIEDCSTILTSSKYSFAARWKRKADLPATSLSSL